MPNSYSREIHLVCPGCRQEFDADIWLILDAAEHKDLLEQLSRDRLNRLTCPHCAAAFQVEAPLLLYFPEGIPVRGKPCHLVFSPPGQANPQEALKNLGELLNHLEHSLGETWQEAWLEDLRMIQRQQLLQQPENDREEPEQSSEKVKGKPVSGIQDVLREFIGARSWNESKRILLEHPELLGEEALQILENFITIDQERKEPQAEQIFKEHLQLLQRCRKVGVEAAFAEKMQGSRSSPQMTVPEEIRADFNELLQLTRPSDMPRRIQICRKILSSIDRQSDPVFWAALEGELANSLAQNPTGNRADNLEQAIQHYELALQVYTRQAFPSDWAMTQNNLANAYSDRIHGDRADNLEQAIQHYELALQVYTRQAFPEQWATTQNNLATAYKNRIRGDRADNLEQAIQHYELALEIRTRQAFPEQCRQTALNLASLLYREKRWEDSLPYYHLAWETDQDIFENSWLRITKTEQARKTTSLYFPLAFALARCNQLPQALAALEAGRARLLGEALERARRDLQSLETAGYGDLLKRYNEVSQHQAGLLRLASQSPENRPTDWHRQVEAAQVEFQAVISAIRGVPGFKTFLRSLDASAIQQQASPEAPLVYLVPTPAGGLALVVLPDQILPLWLERLTETALAEQVQGPAEDPKLGGYLGAYAAWRRPGRTPEIRQAWEAELDRVTRWLWDAVMQPLVEKLAELHLAQAVLVPGGLLGLLPLHAAWTEDSGKPTGRRYALDDVCFTYAPSARALQECREVAGRCQAESLLAVDNPDGSLVFSEDEVRAACAGFDQPTLLVGKAAGRASVLAGLAAHNVLHLSTHGVAGWAEPLESRIKLADGDLTLGEILDLRLPGARLAVLSACETGIPGTRQINEVVSLPTGLVQSGVAGVAASLWSVPEISTAMLMAYFYELWRKKGVPPHEALRQAQIWLRDSTDGEKQVFFQKDLPEFSTVKTPEQTAEVFFQDVVLKDPNGHSFAGLYQWAAFSYTGV